MMVLQNHEQLENTMVLEKEHIWQLAIMWVRSNSVLIRYVASKHYPFMSCTRDDLNGEALLTAFQIIDWLISHEKTLNLTTGLFQTAFKNRCIQLSKGKSQELLAVDTRGLASEGKSTPDYKQIDLKAVSNALSTLTKRQRVIAQWTLNQPRPVQLSMIAKHFAIPASNIHDIIDRAVKRIEENREHGHHRLCKEIAANS